MAYPVSRVTTPGLALLAFTAFGAQLAVAATLTNSDPATVVLTVAEPGGRSDVSLDPGTSQDICPTGCFITLPNGDHLGLNGSEKVDIRGGSATVN